MTLLSFACVGFAASLVLGSCERCYTCSAELPIYINGVETDSTFYNEESFCGRRPTTEPKIDAFESEDYTCEEDD